MSVSYVRGAGSPKERPASLPIRWVFTKEELNNMASIRDGMSREEDLSHRQLAAAFIQDMIDGLNMIKDPRMRITHLGLCAAHIHMHRFFYFNSFKKFDYRDVSAACVFLACKTAETPRKLSHVVQVWRDKKERKQLTTDAARAEAGQIIVLLESMILQVLAFDLNIAMPHVQVLHILEVVDKNQKYRHLRNSGYFFATDVIAVTDWTLRYSIESISVAVVYLIVAYANINIEKLFADWIDKENRWFSRFDKTMTDEKLKEMEMDFIKTYRSTSTFHHASRFNIRVHKFESSEIVAQIRNPEVAQIRNPEVAQIRNPEVAQIKMDRHQRDARSHSPMVTQPHPHHPQDLNKRPRGYVPKDELTVERLNKERHIEEERRKRDHDRMSGRIDNSTGSEKRAKIDPLSSNFVSAANGRPSSGQGMPINVGISNSGPSGSSSKHSSIGNSENKFARRAPPHENSPANPSVFRHSNPGTVTSSPSLDVRSLDVRRVSSVSPSTTTTTTTTATTTMEMEPFNYDEIARAFDVPPILSPPPPPTSMVSSRSADESSDMDLEDGEVE